MSQFIISYLGGKKPSNPEEGKKNFTKFMEWLNSLGESAISPANPVKDKKVVNPDGTVTGGSLTKMSGFTIIETDSIGSAINIAKACPFLETGGSLKVSEIMKMPG